MKISITETERRNWMKELWKKEPNQECKKEKSVVVLGDSLMAGRCTFLKHN